VASQITYETTGTRRIKRLSESAAGVSDGVLWKHRNYVKRRGTYRHFVASQRGISTRWAVHNWELHIMAVM